MSTYDESHVQAVVEEATNRIIAAMPNVTRMDLFACMALSGAYVYASEEATFIDIANDAWRMARLMELLRAAAMADVEPPKEK